MNTICALATASGNAAIAIIRISGKDTFKIVSKIFIPAGKKPFEKTPSSSLRFGTIVPDINKEDIKDKDIIDEVLVSVFRSPRSYTGENSCEISCHPSPYIIRKILELLVDNGADMATPGEFTRRAFVNNKMDLAQAEAVADLISSETESAHNVAMTQMRGGFSQELSDMRAQLVHIVSLMELELDFSEQDVEFADRKELSQLVDKLSKHIVKLVKSFTLGNVIKNGVPCAIVGATNTGKSTFLNAILGEDLAIVSDIDGTTRDSIEDTINLGGVSFRFIDTAGIRNSTETIEMIGIERTYYKMRQASVLILMLDVKREDEIKSSIENFAKKLKETTSEDTLKEDPRDIFILVNKCDTIKKEKLEKILEGIKQNINEYQLKVNKIIPLSAKKKEGIEDFTTALVNSQKDKFSNLDTTLVTNLRHYQALSKSLESLYRVQDGMKQDIPTDLISQDIREALYNIGTITGEISTDEILGDIFKNFCIGK
ncbi:MAG: tRNA uridine-5-carboxymethylaminomethyl(34) synthesis GTPase MnmE [Bacteroidales bacterium]